MEHGEEEAFGFRVFDVGLRVECLDGEGVGEEPGGEGVVRRELLEVCVVYIRQSRPDSGTCKTVTARFWHMQDSHGQIPALTFR